MSRPLDDGWWTPPSLTPGQPAYNMIPRSFYQDIFDAWQNGVKMKDLATQYGVSSRTISKVIHRVLDGE